MAPLNPKTAPLPNGQIRMTWTPDPTCFGYRFYRDGVPVSKSTRPEQSATNFKAETDGKRHAYGIARSVEEAVEISYYPPSPPDPPDPPQTTMTPAEFQARCVPDAVLRNIHVTDGWVTITNPRVKLENVTLDVLQVMSQADDFTWHEGGGRAFYQRGAKRALWSGLKMDGQNRTSNCQLWGWTDGILPSYAISGCEFRNFFNSAPDAHTEGVYMGSCERGILEDSLFEHNGGPGPEHGTGHILIEAYGDTWSDKGYYCVRRNTFGQTDAYFSTQVKEVFTLASRVYIEPGQPTIKPLCQLPQFVRSCQPL